MSVVYIFVRLEKLSDCNTTVISHFTKDRSRKTNIINPCSNAAFHKNCKIILITHFVKCGHTSPA